MNTFSVRGNEEGALCGRSEMSSAKSFEEKERKREKRKTMSSARLFRKMITAMVVVGFIVFCFGYLYLVIAVFQGYNLPSQILPAIIGFALIFLGFFGLEIWRRFFAVRR